MGKELKIVKHINCHLNKNYEVDFIECFMVHLLSIKGTVDIVGSRKIKALKMQFKELENVNGLED